MHQDVGLLSLLFDEFKGRPEHVTHFLALVVAQLEGDVGKLWRVLVTQVHS